MSLDGASKALNLGDQGKSAEGKALIRYFSCPVKPTKANGGRHRNFPKHDPEKWEKYKDYCRQDVVAEIAIIEALSYFELPKSERLNYILDQKINDRGVSVDVEMAENAITIDERHKLEVIERLKAEAVKRGFVEGVKFNAIPSYDGNRHLNCTFKDFDSFSVSGLQAKTPKETWDTNHSNPYIMKNGIWATIINKPKTTYIQVPISEIDSLNSKKLGRFVKELASKY